MQISVKKQHGFPLRGEKKREKNGNAGDVSGKGQL